MHLLYTRTWSQRAIRKGVTNSWMTQEIKPAIARQRPISTVCHQSISGHLAKYSVTYRECEATRFDRRVAEKDKEYVKGRIRETETGSRQAKGTYNGHGEKHPESVWCRFLFLVILGDRLGTFAGQSLRWASEQPRWGKP
jgi:hypothetical protein